MARGATISVENNFTQGLITEFTAMNFPENAVTDTDNCVYSELGSVTRRLGCDFENSASVYALSTITSRANAYTEYKWYSTGPLGTVQFLVQQVGDILTFWTISTSSALSDNKKSFTVNLATYAAPGATADQISERPCQYTTGRSKLVVAHPFCDPFYVSYDADTDSVTATRITIEVRDFKILSTAFAVNERPTTDTNPHKYNMYNQGWDLTTLVVNDNGSGVFTTAIYPRYKNRTARYPSRSDVWFAGRDPNFYNAWFSKTDPYIGSIQYASPAVQGPNGHYVYPAFDINRTSVSGISGLESENSGIARPSATAFYAGRIFYSGVSADGFSDKVYFTQILDEDSKFGKCHQQNDPTSEELSDLLDTDGGVIPLALIETVTSMKVVGDALVVLATNGIYVISGTVQSPFKATDYTVTYLSTIGVTSAQSVVVVDGGIFWWNNDAIYTLAPGQNGSFEVTNISKGTIQSLVDDIPTGNIQYIKGAYNKRDQIVQWLFSDTDELTGYRYNRILELNLVSKAFYPFTIDTTLAPRIAGLASIGGQREVESLENVTDNALVVVTATGPVNVQIEITEFVPNSELFKYTIVGSISSGSPGISYGELRDATYVDWKSFDSVGVDYSSYGISGYRVRGEFLRRFNATPIEYVVRYIDQGRLLVSGIWDYGFRETSTQELYLIRPEVEYLLRRVKMRGKGRALQLKFQSVGNNPFDLVGWSSFDTGGSLP